MGEIGSAKGLEGAMGRDFYVGVILEAKQVWFVNLILYVKASIYIPIIKYGKAPVAATISITKKLLELSFFIIFIYSDK